MGGSIDQQIATAQKQLAALLKQKEELERQIDFDGSLNSFEDLISKIKNEELENISYYNAYFKKDSFISSDFLYDRNIGDHFTINNFDIEIVDYEGGSEGDFKKECYMIFKISDSYNNIKYFKIPGWYESYDGTEWDWNQITEVQKKEKVIEVWE